MTHYMESRTTVHETFKKWQVLQKMMMRDAVDLLLQETKISLADEKKKEVISVCHHLSVHEVAEATVVYIGSCANISCNKTMTMNIFFQKKCHHL